MLASFTSAALARTTRAFSFFSSASFTCCAASFESFLFRGYGE